MRQKSLANFYHQYATMMNAGLAHGRALQVMHKQGDPATRRLATQLTRHLKEGRNLTEAMTAIGTFPALHISLIAAGERSGQLDVVMNRLGAVLEKQASMRASFIGKLIYPAIVLHVAVLVRSVVLLFTESAGAAVWAAVQGFALLYGIVVGGLVIYKLLRSFAPSRVFLDGAFMQMPVLSGLIHNIGIARFARTCEALYLAGYPLPDAVTAGADATGNALLRRRCLKAVPILREGTDMGSAMAFTRALTPMQQGMLETGVESGRLDQMLNKIAEQAEFAAETSLDRIGKIVPLILYFIVVAIVLMQIIGMLRGYVDTIESFM